MKKLITVIAVILFIPIFVTAGFLAVVAGTLYEVYGFVTEIGSMEIKHMKYIDIPALYLETLVDYVSNIFRAYNEED